MRNQNDKARWFRVTGNFIKAKPAKLQTKLCVFVCKIAFFVFNLTRIAATCRTLASTFRTALNTGKWPVFLRRAGTAAAVSSVAAIAAVGASFAHTCSMSRSPRTCPSSCCRPAALSPPSRTFVGKLKSMRAPPPRTVSPAADDAVVCV